jgi:molybdopterin biosynthesis enzyme
MARLRQLVVDCAAPAALARFWAAALDGFAVRPYDDAEIARLAALGFTPETDPGVIVDGPHLEICFQRVEREERAKTPVHLDIAADDREAEVDRLTALGATVHRRFADHVWMRDPEGNDFCVVGAGPG